MERSFTIKEFGEKYYNKVVIKDRKNPEGIHRYLLRDIYPAFGEKQLDKVTTVDILQLIEIKKLKESDSVALELRNLMKQFMILSIIFGFMGAIGGVLSRSSTGIIFIILLITTAFAAFLCWKDIKNDL